MEAEPKAQAAQMTEQTVAQDGSGTDKKADWQAQKAEQARIRKLENTLKKAEERIAELEDLIAGIDEECADPANATNSAKLGELTGRQNEYRSELENATRNGSRYRWSLSREGCRLVVKFLTH